MSAMTANLGYDYRERLGAEAHGLSLLDYLARRYRHSSAAEWRARIEAGRVLIDSRPARTDSVVRRGQLLVWRRPPWREPEAPASFGVLYEDGDLLAVAKPAGLPTLPGGGFLESTLLHRVRARFPDAAPLHRLGRWTSGLVLFTRTPQARRELSRQWKRREITKRYRALACGRPRRCKFTIDRPIGPVPHPLLGSVHGVSATGKASRTRVHVIERRADSFLCDVRIETGRPHQIRIHLAAAGYPLVGDSLYVSGGLPAPGCVVLPGDPGYRLHAAQLVFLHPRTGQLTTLTCAPPLELRRGAGKGARAARTPSSEFGRV
jgi:23S rRNA pseudouridine1911/1915/1917 synthase